MLISMHVSNMERVDRDLRRMINRFANFLPRNYDMDKLEAALLTANGGRRLQGGGHNGKK